MTSMTSQQSIEIWLIGIVLIAFGQSHTRDGRGPCLPSRILQTPTDRYSTVRSDILRPCACGCPDDPRAEWTQRRVDLGDDRHIPVRDRAGVDPDPHPQADLAGL